MKKWTVAILLLLITAIARFPFYFVDVINWDESTFILMGQSLLDGHLPYTELWDIKPPLAFVAYALFILLFGKSIVGIRLAGTLCVFITSWFVYLIGRHICSDRAGLFAAILTIVGVTAIRGAQSTMTEHVACIFLVGGLAWLTTRKTSPSTLFIVGILLTLATLVRLNLAYVVIAVGLWLVYSLRHQTTNLQGIATYCLGSFSTIFLTYFPYLVTNKSTIWLNSVVLAPLSYSSSVENAGTWTKLIPACLAFCLIIFLWSKISAHKQKEFILLQVFILATSISIIRGGEFHQHYYIQLSPLLALTIALLWDKVPNRLIRLLFVGLITIALSSTLEPISAEYQVLGDRFRANLPLRHGAAYEIAAYLREHNPEQAPVYMMKDHIIYWLTDLEPLSKAATHPSNIAKDYLFKYVAGAQASSTAELNRILAQKPKFIIKRAEESYIDENPVIKSILLDRLKQNYRLDRQISDRYIYKAI